MNTRGPFIYKQFNNGERSVFGSDNSAILRAAYMISKGKFLFVSSFCVVLFYYVAVKRKDASLNKILTRCNRVACHYHSLK